MSKHTPGPWFLESEVREGGTERYVVTESGLLIMWTPTSPYASESDSELDANARLIAAAPDLLVELCMLVAWAEGGRVPAPALARARAAIAKAEGTES